MLNTNPNEELLVLSLGANLGNKLATLQDAIKYLQETEIIIKPIVSSFYESEPIGYTSQPNFINIAVLGRTFYYPEQILFLIKSIEYFLGRKVRQRWNEREIDIDIIFYGNKIIKNKFLTIPHQEMHNRKFVLLPLYEIAKELIHPLFKKNIEKLILNCNDNSKVEKLKIGNT